MDTGASFLSFSRIFVICSPMTFFDYITGGKKQQISCLQQICFLNQSLASSVSLDLAAKSKFMHKCMSASLLSFSNYRLEIS